MEIRQEELIEGKITKKNQHQKGYAAKEKRYDLKRRVKVKNLPGTLKGKRSESCQKVRP